MTDRFVGLRYAITLELTDGKANPTIIMEDIRDKADTALCFGWSQYAVESSQVVGEIRCYRHRAPSVFLHLQGKYGDYLALKEYSDTKIKLHYSHFLILDSNVMTCFRDEPHQCLS